MRTDAKIGFAIGGVLLAVLTVYAIVVPKHKKTTANTVTLVTPPAQSASNNNDVTPIPAPMTVMGEPTPPASKETVIPPTPVTPPVATNTGNLSEDGVFHPASKPEVTKADDQKPTGPIFDQTPMDPIPSTPHGKPAHSKTAPAKQPAGEDAVASGDAHPYTIKSGETLSSIASEVYGNARFWVAIQRENKGLDANHLKVGAKIMLPDISPLQPGPITVADDEVAAPTHSVAGAKDAHTYVVKSGDSLYGICKKLFGSGHKADALYALNKDKIGPDKSKLKLGMVLRLPDSAPVAIAN